MTLPLKLVHSTQIPARESCTVLAHLQISSAGTVYFQPDSNIQQNKSVAMSPSLLNVHNYTTYLQIFNPTEKTCTISRNSLLGHVTHTPSNTESFRVLRPSSYNKPNSPSGAVLTTITSQATVSSPLQVIEKLVNHVHNPSDKQCLRLVLQQHSNVFDSSIITQATTPVYHTIYTGDHLPISSRPYPKTIQQRRELQDEIEKMLEQHQIRPSIYPWSSPVIIHKKKDGGIRFLVDYRKLNSITKKDSFSQPTAEELLQRLGGHRFYSKLDLKSGYFQLPIHEDDKEKTAFITQDGLWEFNVLPQGVMKGPPTFQRTMHNLIGNKRWDYVLVYLDDILIFSRTFDEHVRHLREILSLLAKAHFQVNAAKCTIAVNEINFLSHTINERCIQPTGEKIKAIVDLPSPTTLKDANEFLGKINWYRKFIPNFAKIAAPLYTVTNKTKQHKHEFFWGPDQQHSFDSFKHLLTTSPLFLEYPDPATPFTLTTDASDIGIGGILWQATASGRKINYYKSRVLTDTEQKYDTFEKEALAIFWCITDLRSYLGDSPFTIETDHKPLENFHLKHINNKRVMNWIFKLQDLLPQIIEVKYRKGATNTAADYISRHFPSPSLIKPSLHHINFANDSWTLDIEHGKSEEPKPQRSQFINTVSPPHTACNTTQPDPQVNAVTTRAQTRRMNSSHLPTNSADTTVSSTTSSGAVSSPHSTIYDFSLSRFRIEQEKDSVIQTIIKNLSTSHHQQSCFVRDGLLYKRIVRGRRTIKVLYVPLVLVSEVLSAYHDHPLSGHFGVERTWNRLRNQYYWSHMKQSIISYIRSCDLFCKFNVTRHKPSGTLRPISPPNEVFQVLGMDWWGPAPTSLDGNKYVLVLTDRLSGYVIATASPTNSAQDTAGILMEQVILIHGPPDKIITDQGLHFKNELLQAITNLVGCEHVFSTPYHPQTNGQTERWNSTFATQLSKYCNTDYNNWDTYLAFIVYAYNHGIHHSTGYTPYELAFGRQPRNLFAPSHSTFHFRKPYDYWKQIINYKKVALQQAKSNIIQQQQHSKTRYDLNRPQPEYKVGDLVWIKLLQGRSKLSARYYGPGRIIQLLTPVSFLVEDDIGRSVQVHSSTLKPVYLRH